MIANIGIVAAEPAYGFQPWHWLILLLVLAVVAGALWFVAWLVTKSTRQSMQDHSGAAPAGWYPDPGDPTAFRYFDGRAWLPDTWRPPT